MSRYYRAYAAPAAAFLALTAMQALYCRHSDGDDTYIYLRYIRNILRGDGWTFNPGHHINACTSSAWVVLSLLPSALFGDSITVLRAECYVLLFATSVITFFIFRRIGLGVFNATLFSLICQLDPHGWRWGGTGMEGPLVCAATACSAYLTLTLLRAVEFSDDDRASRPMAWIATGLIIGSLPWVRPELGLLALMFFIVISSSLLAQKPPTSQPQSTPARLSPDGRWIKLAASAFITGGIPAIASLLSFGSIVPHTAKAKAFMLGGIPLSQSLIHTAAIVVSGGAGGLFLIAALSAVILIGARHGGAGTHFFRVICRRPVALVAGALIVQGVGIALVMGFSGALISTRYSTVMVFPILLGAMMAGAGALSSPRSTSAATGEVRSKRCGSLLIENRLIASLCGVGAAFQVVGAMAVGFYFFPVTRVYMADPDNGRRQMADYLAQHTPTTARVATTEIGLLGFISNRYIVDLVALVDDDGLTYAKKHGRWTTPTQIEAYLAYKHADYYITHNDAPPLEDGKYYHFRNLVTFLETNTNLSAGRHPRAMRITLYELLSKSGDAATRESEADGVADR